jgi:hypothetical protein
MRRVIARPPLRDLNGNTRSDRDSYGAIFEDHGPLQRFGDETAAGAAGLAAAFKRDRRSGQSE